MSEQYAKEFEEKRYVHLKNFVDKESCDGFVKYMNEQIEAGNTKKDPQCPLSEAIHGGLAFDGLLEQLLPHFEKASGKKLLPTYAYARKYAPGDELKIHRDRPACEISATVNLGFSGKKWPIWMGYESDKDNGKEYINKTGEKIFINGENSIDMEIGDAVLYHGQELYHWREPYEGDWQVQVFLHYVDADGPNTEWKYDKRLGLSHHRDMLSDNIEVVCHGQAIVYHNAFSKETCAKIIESIEKEKGIEAAVGNAEHERIDKTIRDVNRISIPIDKGIGATLTGIGINVNNLYYNFDVKGSNQAEFLKYDENGHYKMHIDTFFEFKNPNYDSFQSRKLTILLFLNDDFEGGQIYLQTEENRFYPPQKAGNVLIFPSFFPHCVEPVTKGKRVSLVNWLVGPMFK